SSFLIFSIFSGESGFPCPRSIVPFEHGFDGGSVWSDLAAALPCQAPHSSRQPALGAAEPWPAARTVNKKAELPAMAPDATTCGNPAVFQSCSESYERLVAFRPSLTRGLAFEIEKLVK